MTPWYMFHVYGRFVLVYKFCASLCVWLISTMHGTNNINELVLILAYFLTYTVEILRIMYFYYRHSYLTTVFCMEYGER